MDKNIVYVPVSVEDELPPFNIDITFIGKISWKKTGDNISVFNDKLTRSEEQLEYGKFAYLLDTHSDFLVNNYPESEMAELCSEYVTHWLKPISIDELMKEKTKVLTETLKIVHESLKTYGSHPIIDRQVFKALLNKQ